jgi:hypothetical protein
MFTADSHVHTLNEELAEIRNASLTMNDRFVAEAALISRELLLDLMAKHDCSLQAVTPAHIIAELKLRAPMAYTLPSIPEKTSCPD